MDELKPGGRGPRTGRVDPRDRDGGPLDALSGIVLRTRAALLLERLTRAFWPVASLMFAAWSLTAFGLAEPLSRGQLVAAIGLVAVAALALVAWGARRLRWPSRADALARLDADLPGRPLAALADAQALGRDDAGSIAIWSAHRARMARAARLARATWPDLRLARRDPWALRLMALVMLFAALVFARGDGVETIGAALVTPGTASVASGPSYEAWAEPPAYTGLPTLYLPEVPSERPVTVPQGTTITLRIYGEPGGFTLTETVAASEHAGIVGAAEGIATATFPVDRSGSLRLDEGERRLGEWSFVMRPDAAPTITLAEPVARATGGATRIVYTAEDDYGVTAAWAEAALDLSRVDRRYGLAVEPADPAPLRIDLPMPITGEGALVEETLVEDFSKHPLAGLPVRLTLTAEDAIGQLGSQPGVEVVLPRRRFFDPAAAALIEQRRDVLWSPENVDRVIQVLRAVTHRPEDVIDSERAYLLSRTAIRWLVRARDEGSVPEVTPEVAETLWQAALILEEGSLGDAAERLAQAQERLREALQSDASDDEIAELMEELREATREYMEQLAEQAIENGEMQQQAQRPDGPTINQDQIQELMDRIQELSEQGRRAEAEQLLEMLERMLENMEMMATQGGPGGQGGPGQQMMQDLADTLREQQDLADESFQQLQREFRQNRQGQSQGQGQGDPQDAPGSDGAEGPDDLAGRQEALREMLDALRGDLPEAGAEAGEAAREALREAERSMGEAADNLEQGDTSNALDRQAEAIDRLRDGMRGLSEEMRQAQAGGQDQTGAESGDAFSDAQNDPLGRPSGSRGDIGTNESMLPEADARARARALLDEIRRRAGDLSRPEVELNYLRRLLERF
jgi:uncharacterized protein (TIGR02302 family)